MKKFLLGLNRKFQWLLPLHVFATFVMTGIILFVQFVHYPLFRYVDPAKFFDFYTQHVVRFTPFVGCIMIIELFTALGLFVTRLKLVWTINFLLVVIGWLLTGFWQGPIQMHLSKGYDPALVELLIRSNIWRTVVWCLHSAIVFVNIMAAVRHFFKLGERR